jgi:chemotaxis-related protein WspB
MLALTFQIGRSRLALDTRWVKEVVPRVPLQPLDCGPPWLAGVFVYRGQIVPVLDLHRLVGAGDCPPHLSSRIILVPHRHDGEDRLLGLLAAQVADLREFPAGVRPARGLTEPGRAELGPLLVDGGEVIHLLEPHRLLPEAVQGQLTALPREAPA